MGCLLISCGLIVPVLFTYTCLCVSKVCMNANGSVHGPKVSICKCSIQYESDEYVIINSVGIRAHSQIEHQHASSTFCINFVVSDL